MKSMALVLVGVGLVGLCACGPKSENAAQVDAPVAVEAAANSTSVNVATEGVTVNATAAAVVAAPVKK